KNRWWLAVVVTVLFVLLARFAMQDRGPAIASFQARMWVGGKIQLDETRIYREEGQDYYGTQMELMKSRTVQRRAYESVRKQLPDAPEIPVSINISLSPRAAIFTLLASGSDPAYVQTYLNAVMEEYLQYKREVRNQSTDLTLASISGQLTRMNAEFEGAHELLNTFLRTNSVSDLQQQSAGAGSYLAELNRKLADLSMQSNFLELIASDKNLDGIPVGSSATPPGTAEIHLAATREIARLKARQAELGHNLRPRHPRMIELADAIRSQEEILKFSHQQSREELRKTQVALGLEIHNTEAVIREWENRALEASSRMAEYDRLKENAARAERLHDYLRSLVRNIDVNKHLDQETIAVLERAEPVPARHKVQLPKELLGGFAGFFAAMGVMVLLMFTNDRVSSAEELDGRLTVPVIGQIPEVKHRNGNALPLLLESGDARHGFAESLKSIRSSLFYSTISGTRPKSLLVTSALPGEGKSTVAVNLARAFAFSGYRVLLVDGDLRCSVLPGLLDAPRSPGLSDVLNDGKDLAEAVVPTRIPNLFFLPPGRVVNNPGELFLSMATDRFLSKVYEDYDYVVIDSVPVLAADDTTSLAPKVEGIVFVVRGSSTTTRLAQRALELLHNRQGCVLGVVCNRGADTIADYNYYKAYNSNAQS
ncbi:MAG: polysaccharide biosynthesis tyrosine autokinase, partial [Akkermansiaceae bacterium]|nr:polysaccharide biosynthesis tyrosine autokinase [Verrucomicrobiales bacterium]